jgi:hypothetical protein
MARYIWLTSVGGADLGLRGGDAGDGDALQRAAQRMRPVLAQKLNRPALPNHRQHPTI